MLSKLSVSFLLALEVNQHLTLHESFYGSRSILQLRVKYYIQFLSYALLTGTESAVRRRRIRHYFFYSEFTGLKYKRLIEYFVI
ncbi:hypothetical protein FWJ33_15225 [Leptospira interrogans serovar Hardjo]|nr:hypothetical protein B0191_14130 [Leptospira interrogans serovar Hardjo]QEI00627.1 hypothetical protein FWJ33_15225 [Leptospira interrogans serovar Hardjo]QOI33911.1 hypothetical protein LeptoLang_06555 [Leptospira interrogans serovar Icterohaemorrhagiae]